MTPTRPSTHPAPASRARARTAIRPRRIALLALAAALACGDDPREREPLVVATTSGGTTGLTGTAWEGCFNDALGVPSVRQREIHGEEGAVTFVRTAFDGRDCTGAEIGAENPPAIARARGTAAVGWDGDPPQGLEPTVSATRVELEGGGFPYGDVYLVDDAVSPRVLYTGAGALGEDGYPTQLLTTGAVEQPAP